ncbi:hypothetical protein HPB50_012100 [Hyalomma asiaticum]|uniref:Uncharacterized protein n=1 Tax=Hyalomma asiaticum TaxID=266040 RepID=A0ACB7SGR6_HYAAI|nr:hypothetical protein HPB50_012100 [Hyalomma asiaticum]
MEQREHLDDLSPGTAVIAPGHVPSSSVVGGTNTITLPTLRLTDPSLWFIQVENKFRIHRNTSEVRKHELLVEALPPQSMAEIRDILVGPPGETPYTTVKQALLHRLPAQQRSLNQPEHRFSSQHTCYYHRRFLAAARKCVPPGSWHGERPGRSSITAAGDQGHSSSRLFHVTDKTTGLRLLADT